MKYTCRLLLTIALMSTLATLPMRVPPVRAAGAMPTIRIGVYQASVWSLPIFAAQSQGFFARNGLQAELVPVTSGPNAIAALAGRSIDMFSASPEVVLPAISRGVDVQVVSGLTKMFWIVLANNALAKPSGKYPRSLDVLKGQKVGVVALGANSDAIAQGMLADAGIPVDSVTRVAVGVGQTAAAALEQNLVQAVVTAPPASDDILASGKAYVLADLRQPGIGPSYIRDTDYEANWAEASYIKEHPDVIAKVQKSVAQAVLWLQAPSNRQAVKQFVATTMPDPAVLKNLDGVVSENMPVFTAAYNVQSLEAYNKFDVQYGFLKKPLDNVGKLLAPGVPENPAMVRRLAGER
jgi:NitT/TauT family transport system substrate-binding protein